MFLPPMVLKEEIIMVKLKHMFYLILEFGGQKCRIDLHTKRKAFNAKENNIYTYVGFFGFIRERSSVLRKNAELDKILSNKRLRKEHPYDNYIFMSVLCLLSVMTNMLATS